MTIWVDSGPPTGPKPTEIGSSGLAWRAETAQAGVLRDRYHLRMETVKHAPSMTRRTRTAAAAASMWGTPVPPLPKREKAAPVTPTEVLDDLVASVAATRGAVLATVDGFHLANSSNMAAEPAHAAMLAAAVGLARQLIAMGGGSTLRQLVVDHDGGLLLVWPIGSQRVLAVMTESVVDQRALRSAVQTHARSLSARQARSAS